MKKLPKPPMNLSPEAVRLRKAALEFAKGIDGPTGDLDIAGQRRNLRLMAAAFDYVSIARGVANSKEEPGHVTYGAVEIVEGKKQYATFEVPKDRWKKEAS